MRATFRCLVFFTLGVGGAACGNTGDVVVRANGDLSDAIDAAFFADGSNVVFDTFAVVVDRAAVADVDVAGPAVVDVSGGADPVEVGVIKGLDAGRTDVVAAVAPIGDRVVVGGNAGSAVGDAMKSAGFSVFVAGSAVVDGVNKTFSWGFTTNTRYVDCHDVDGEAGITVTAGAQTEWQLTFHGDHLFLPTLDDESEAQQLRFAPLAAADDNGDNAIDVDELQGVEIGDVEGYDASADPSVVTLYDFLQAQSRTLLHINGDGECAFEKR